MRWREPCHLLALTDAVAVERARVTENFRTSASALRKKPAGSATDTEAAILTETSCCSRNTDRSVSRIVQGFNFHPYKMVVVQELSGHHMANRRKLVQRVIEL
jgi:hypothetical protein